MASLKFDDFNRANGADLGATWDWNTSTASPFEINTNAARITTGNENTDGEETDNSVTWPNDQEGEATLGTTTASGVGAGYGVVCRSAGTINTGYRLVGNGSGYELMRFNTGTGTSLSSGSGTTFATGDRIKLRLAGAVWTCYKNGTQFASGTDGTPVASGKAGVAYSSVDGTATGINAWEGFDLTGAAASAVAGTTRKKTRRPGRGPYSTGRYLRPRIDVFSTPPAAIAAGLSTETDTALALAPVQILGTGLAAETDTALALTAKQILGAGLAIETDTALALSSGVVGIASETDAALALSGVGIRAAGFATESDSALSLAAVDIRPAGLATETDASLALLPVQLRLVGTAIETDSALGLQGGSIASVVDNVGSQRNRPGRGPYSLGRMFRPRLDVFRDPLAGAAVGLATEADIALALLPVQLKAAGRSDESDVALALSAGSGSAVGRSDEVDSALALAGVQRRAVGQANETDAALALAAIQIRSIGRADETDTAIALTPSGGSSVGLANESDSALALQGKQIRAVGMCAEANSALTLGLVVARSAGMAIEVDAAFALAAVQRMQSGLAVEIDTALALVPVGAFPDDPSTFYLYAVPGRSLLYLVQ